MKKIILLCMLLCTGILSAQIAVITRNKPLTGIRAAYYPVLSEDGSRILYTGEDYKGLYCYDLNGETGQKITDAAGAGYEPVFGKEAEEVYYREISYKSGRRYSSLYRYQGEGEKEAVIKNMRSLKKPLVCRQGISVIGEGSLKKSSLRSRSVTTPPVYVCIEENRIALYRDGVRTLLAPVGEEVAGYLWASLSPDGSRILFHAAGKGSYICDPEGRVESFLGQLSSPVWYGNDYVVGMECRDNGEQFTWGRIVMVSRDGRIRQNLTDGKEIAMYPAVSSEQGRIAYNTSDGRLYVMEISLIR